MSHPSIHLFIIHPSIHSFLYLSIHLVQSSLVQSTSVGRRAVEEQRHLHHYTRTQDRVYDEARRDLWQRTDRPHIDHHCSLYMMMIIIVMVMIMMMGQQLGLRHIEHPLELENIRLTSSIHPIDASLILLPTYLPSLDDLHTCNDHHIHITYLSTTNYLTSPIYHHLSNITNLPSSIYHHLSTTNYLTSPIYHNLSNITYLPPTI